MAEHDFCPAWGSNGAVRISSSLSKCSLKVPSRVWWKHNQASRSASCQIYPIWMWNCPLTLDPASRASHTVIWMPRFQPTPEQQVYINIYLPFQWWVFCLTLAITCCVIAVRPYHSYLSCGDGHSHLKIEL